MRTYRLIALLTVLLAAVGALTAAPAVAVPPVPPLAPVALHPDGLASSSERYVRSPVTFSARAADGDPFVEIRYVVQRLVPGGTEPVFNQVAGRPELTLADGDYRWRARVSKDGVAGAWSAFIRFTVDSRVPAAPVVSIPDDGVVVGRPVPVHIESPDGLAVFYYLSDDPTQASFGTGTDPCTVRGVVCPATPGAAVTVPVAFLHPRVDQLYVRAYSRASAVSPASDVLDVAPSPDYDSLFAGRRWAVPTESGPAAKLPDPNGGPALLVGPTLAATSQTLVIGGDPGGDPGPDSARAGTTVQVPSLDTATSTNVRSAAAVVDTATTFSVGVVVSRTVAPRAGLAVLAQAAADGDAFSLVLTREGFWRFCVTTTDSVATCVTTQAFRFDAVEPVVVSYDAVGGRIAVSTEDSRSDVETLPGPAALRPAVGGLRFAAGTAGSGRYRGALGSPVVAAGWVTGADLASTLQPPA